MHWPLHLRGERYFRKCGFHDHCEAWEWKAESSNGKSIFVMPNCGCVLVGSTSVGKKKEDVYKPSQEIAEGKTPNP